jgi:3-oxoacyl-[acyl-carrier-protein] synthase II
MSHRVVITGVGLLTPLGRGVDEFWPNLLAGQSGIGPITLFDARSLPVRIGGEVKGFDAARVRRGFPGVAAEKDRKIWLGLDAAVQAVADSSLPDTAFARAPLYVGVSLETFHLEDVAAVAHATDLTAALAAHLRSQGAGLQLQTPLDRVAAQLSARYGLRGGRYINCSACAAGAQAIGEAFRRLRDGGGEVALAGATDSILNPLGLGGFSLLQILSAENDRPTQACRPFDATRQGTVLAEGAAFLVLETGPHARQRGARIYAEIAGYASSLDAFRVSDPEPAGRGATRSMARAIADAGLTPVEIDSINAHGTGTPKNDVAETLAIKQVFGERAHRIPITANKSMTGHMIAASGAVEAVASALALQTGKIPPTINLVMPDPQCDLDYTAGHARDFSGATMLSNSFGFGGQNASLVFRRYPPCTITNNC